VFREEPQILPQRGQFASTEKLIGSWCKRNGTQRKVWTKRGGS